MVHEPRLDLQPWTLEDIPDQDGAEFQTFLDSMFSLGEAVAESMNKWHQGGTKQNGSVQIVDVPSSSSYNQIRKDLGFKEYWCGRESHHTSESVRQYTKGLPTAAGAPLEPTSSIVNMVGRRLSQIVPGHSKSRVSEVEKQAEVMNTDPTGLYERFRRGLLEYHSENEREYIESMRESECLQVFQPHIAEVWRLTYVTPPPTNPRTFVVLLLSRELKSDPKGERCFMNISMPFAHPSCPEKAGPEKSRVRGKYVSVERVRERDGGTVVEWRMCTSSDAGGNIPRFITNNSLAGSISEDVPSFLKWMVKRFPEGGEVETQTPGDMH